MNLFYRLMSASGLLAFGLVSTLIGGALGGAGHGLTFFYDLATAPSMVGIWVWVLFALLAFLKNRLTGFCMILLLALQWGEVAWNILHSRYEPNTIREALKVFPGLLITNFILVFVGYVLIIFNIQTKLKDGKT